MVSKFIRLDLGVDASSGAVIWKELVRLVQDIRRTLKPNDHGEVVIAVGLVEWL